MRRLMLIALTTSALAFARRRSRRRSLPHHGDQQRIQGSWVLTMQGHNGKQNQVAGDTRWVFGQGKMQIVTGGRSYDWEYSIEPTVVPRTLDMRYRPSGGEGSLLKAVYSLENDTLTIAYGNWNDRPKSLRGDEPSKLVMTFKARA